MKQYNPVRILITIVLLSYFILPAIGAVLAFGDMLGGLGINLDFLSNDYARITDVSYRAVVDDSPNSYGRIKVTERLTFDIHAASESNPFWELWRDMPEANIDGVHVHYKVNSVKQILDDGSYIEYKEAPKVYYYDNDYIDTESGLGPYKWFYSKGPYNEDKEQYECVLMYVDGIYRDTMTFEIEYEMYNAALRYGDCSELYLSMFSGDSVYHLNSYKSEILFPNDKMPKEGNYTVHTLGTNKNSFPVEESTTVNPGYTTFTMELNKNDLKFKPYNNYIEFTLVAFNEDKHIFTENASINSYYYSNVLDEVNDDIEYYQTLPQKYGNYKKLAFVACIILCYFVVSKAVRKVEKIKSKYTFYEPTINDGYYRDIPSNLDPLFAVHIAFCRDNPNRDMKDIYAALLLSLARKKYVELVKVDPTKDWKPANTKVVIKYMPTIVDENNNTVERTYEELTPNEKEYFNMIATYCTNNEITLDKFQAQVSIHYERTDKFVTALETSKTTIGFNQGYYQVPKYTEVRDSLAASQWGCIILAVVFGIVVNLWSMSTRLDLAYGGFFALAASYVVAAYTYHKAKKHSLLLTQFGEDETRRWRGLYEFLNSETLMNERTVVELPLWEQYLVYATAFGISDKVIKAIQIRCPDIADQSPILNTNSAYRSTHFYTSSRSIRTSSNNASSFSHSGGYGGYGGGGRGGGGGGGGH